MPVWNLNYRFKFCLFCRKKRDHTAHTYVGKVTIVKRSEEPISCSQFSDRGTTIHQNITDYLGNSEESYCSVLSTEHRVKSVYLCTLFESTRISASKNKLWTFQYIKCTMLRNCWKQSHIHPKLFVARKCQWQISHKGGIVQRKSKEK